MARAALERRSKKLKAVFRRTRKVSLKEVGIRWLLSTPNFGFVSGKMSPMTWRMKEL